MDRLDEPRPHGREALWGSAVPARNQSQSINLSAASDPAPFQRLRGKAGARPEQGRGAGAEAGGGRGDRGAPRGGGVPRRGQRHLAPRLLLLPSKSARSSSFFSDSHHVKPLLSFRNGVGSVIDFEAVARALRQSRVTPRPFAADYASVSDSAKLAVPRRGQGRPRPPPPARLRPGPPGGEQAAHRGMARAAPSGRENAAAARTPCTSACMQSPLGVFLPSPWLAEAPGPEAPAGAALGQFKY